MTSSSSKPKFAARPARARPVALRREGQIPAIAYGKELADGLPRGRAQGPDRDPEERARPEHGGRAGIEGGKKLTALLARVHGAPRLARAFFTPTSSRSSSTSRSTSKSRSSAKARRPAWCSAASCARSIASCPSAACPRQIPTLIEHDVTALNLGDHVKTGDLTLPEGVTVRLPADQTVAGIVAPEKEKPEDVEADRCRRRALPLLEPRRCRSGCWRSWRCRSGCRRSWRCCRSRQRRQEGCSAGKDKKK